MAPPAAMPAMAAYRSRIQIMGDILATAGRGGQGRAGGGGGATVTRLVKEASVPHGRISGMLQLLVSRGLLEQVGSGGACRYRTSRTGREFLRAYESFSRFSDDFGLSI